MNTKKKVKWGILGTAKIAADRLVPAFHESVISELVAVASRDRDRTKEFADEHHIPQACAGYDALHESARRGVPMEVGLAG